MRRTRARLLCGRCILFRRQGREPFGRPQDERLIEHWHADGVEHRGEAADAVSHAGMIGGVEAGHEPSVVRPVRRHHRRAARAGRMPVGSHADAPEHRAQHDRRGILRKI